MNWAEARLAPGGLQGYWCSHEFIKNIGVKRNKIMEWVLIAIVAAVVMGLALFKRMTFVSQEKGEELVRQGALVVDVRTPGEFQSSHISGAVNIPLGDLSSEAPQQLPDKDRPILVHCLSGSRSSIAMKKLHGLGYNSVHNLGSYGRADKIVKAARRS
jgi:phage shock protein E